MFAAIIFVGGLLLDQILGVTMDGYEAIDYSKIDWSTKDSTTNSTSNTKSYGDKCLVRFDEFGAWMKRDQYGNHTYRKVRVTDAEAVSNTVFYGEREVDRYNIIDLYQ